MEELGEVFTEDWERLQRLRVVAKDVLGVLSRKKKVLKETWCWNKDVQECIQQKKKAKRRWDREGSEERNREYKKCCKQVKKAVVLAMVEAYRRLYESLDLRRERRRRTG